MLQKINFLVYFFIILILNSCSGGIKLSNDVVSDGHIEYVETYYMPFKVKLRRCILSNEIKKRAYYYIQQNDIDFDFYTYTTFENKIESLNVVSDFDEEVFCVRAHLTFKYKGYKKVELFFLPNKRIVYKGKLYEKDEDFLNLLNLG